MVLEVASRLGPLVAPLHPMDAPRHVLVVESTMSCADELRRHHFRVVALADVEAAAEVRE